MAAQLMLAAHVAYGAGGGQAASPAVKAGAYYFDGWTGKTTRWHLPDRLKNEFGHRKPVWGWVTSTPEIVRKQIDCAADHGLQFFAFCWYCPEGPEKDTPLNNALDLFLTAPNRTRLQFCLLVANHAGYSIGPQDWDACCARWIRLFRHGSCMPGTSMGKAPI